MTDLTYTEVNSNIFWMKSVPIPTEQVETGCSGFLFPLNVEYVAEWSHFWHKYSLIPQEGSGNTRPSWPLEIPGHSVKTMKEQGRMSQLF